MQDLVVRMLGNVISIQASDAAAGRATGSGVDVGRACLAREGLPYCQMPRDREAVQRNVSRIRAFEVSRDAVRKAFSSATCGALGRSNRIRSGADSMWLVGMMFGHPWRMAPISSDCATENDVDMAAVVKVATVVSVAFWPTKVTRRCRYSASGSLEKLSLQFFPHAWTATISPRNLWSRRYS